MLHWPGWVQVWEVWEFFSLRLGLWGRLFLRPPLVWREYRSHLGAGTLKEGPQKLWLGIPKLVVGRPFSRGRLGFSGQQFFHRDVFSPPFRGPYRSEVQRMTSPLSPTVPGRSRDPLGATVDGGWPTQLEARVPSPSSSTQITTKQRRSFFSFFQTPPQSTHFVCLLLFSTHD